MECRCYGCCYFDLFVAILVVYSFNTFCALLLVDASIEDIDGVRYADLELVRDNGLKLMRRRLNNRLCF